MCASTTIASLKFPLQDPLQAVATSSNNHTTIISSKLKCFIKQAGLFNVNHPTQLITHVDAAHANELRQRCSTTGHGCFLAGGVVAYRSRTQSVCAQSSTEAELIAANAAAKVTKYLCFILHELGYTQTEPTPIYEDNDSAIKIVKHSQPTDRSRHVKIRYFALQHWRLMKDIILIHLPGFVNPVDMLTKALGWVLHHRHAPYLMGHCGNPCW